MEFDMYCEQLPTTIRFTLKLRLTWACRKEKGNCFTARKEILEHIQFSELQIEAIRNVCKLDQRAFISKLVLITSKESNKNYQSLHIKLAGALSSRPDICSDVAILFRIIKGSFKEMTNKYIKKHQRHCDSSR